MMMFSIPDMEWLVSYGKIPSNALHFEHTYYLDEDLTRQLLHNAGFVVVDVQRFSNHSLFFKCVKSKVLPEQYPIRLRNTIRERFEQNHAHWLVKINEFNLEIDNTLSNAYLFGCHVSSQYFIQNGLTGLDGVLDNSPWKVGKRLYGTDYMTMSPNEIVGQDSPIVICSGCGSYTEEVCTQLRALNPTVRLL